MLSLTRRVGTIAHQIQHRRLSNGSGPSLLPAVASFACKSPVIGSESAQAIKQYFHGPESIIRLHWLYGKYYLIARTVAVTIAY